MVNEPPKVRNFQVGDTVMVRDYRQRNLVTWVKARIVAKTGNIVYYCKLKNGMVYKRHSNQIRQVLELGDSEGEEDSRSEVLHAKQKKIGITSKLVTSELQPQLQVPFKHHHKFHRHQHYILH